MTEDGKRDTRRPDDAGTLGLLEATSHGVCLVSEPARFAYITTTGHTHSGDVVSLDGWVLVNADLLASPHVRHPARTLGRSGEP